MAKNNHYKKPQETKPEEKKQKALYITMMAGALVVLAICLALIILPEVSGSGSGGSADIYADITVKNYGTITVKLEPEKAPETVENFVKLAESGFYDGLTFHRIMEGFMMQGGAPKGNGTGSSSQKIKGEFAANGFTQNDLKHTAGAISMARGNGYNSGSCQFFIVHEDSYSLDGLYACFGYVTKGMEIVDKICTDAKPTDNNGTIPKDQQPIIESVKIRK